MAQILSAQGGFASGVLDENGVHTGTGLKDKDSDVYGVAPAGFMASRSEAHEAIIGRISPPADYPEICGEGVKLHIVRTPQGIIMKAEHAIRDFLEDAHKELGEIVAQGSGKGSVIGFGQQITPTVDLLRLGALINRAELLLEAHAAARCDGFGASLVVRKIASEALKLFEHFQLNVDFSADKSRLSASERQPFLAQLVEIRAGLRGLIHYFDGQMLEFASSTPELSGALSGARGAEAGTPRVE